MTFIKTPQPHGAPSGASADPGVLLAAVLRMRGQVCAEIAWGGFGSIGIELLLLAVFIYLGVTLAVPWTFLLMVPALLWSIGYKLVDGVRPKRAPAGADVTMRGAVAETLALLDYQAAFQRKVFRRSQLPMAFAMLAFFTHVSWQSAGSLTEFLGATAFFSVFVLAIYAFTYYVGRRTVRKRYEPRRQELRTLLERLDAGTTSEAAGEYPLLMGVKRCARPRRRRAAAGLCVVALLVLCGGAAAFLNSRDAEYPKRSPFSHVRWQDAEPEVRVDGTWYTLVSLDGIPATEILAYSQQTYGDLWQKRFEEDLVEVLAGMGHQPKDTVTLVVVPLAPPSLQALETVGVTDANREAISNLRETLGHPEQFDATPQTLEGVAMTEDNRRAIRNLNQIRERRQQVEALRDTVAVEDAGTLLAELVPRLRAEKDLVGLAAMVTVDGQMIASAADGERKKGSGVPLTVGDRWHLGSITKSITATTIARLVESGQMRWDDTLGETFSGAPMHDAWKPVTVRHLLTHTSGAPANFSFLTPRHRPAPGPERVQARLDAVLKVLAKKPEHAPGEAFAYSNIGYTIAGAMAEKTAGATWEELVQREVFAPLALEGAGFGPPASPGETLEQPRGHMVLLGWKFAMSDQDDNTPIIGPAGIVHMTLADLCAYALDHMRGELGEGTLLAPETYKFLHAPELDAYACGWVVDEPGAEIQHTVFWHNGSNTMWYALVAFIPDKNMVVAVTSNDGDIDKAEDAAWDIVRACGNRIDTGGGQQEETGPGAQFINEAAIQEHFDAVLDAARVDAGFSGAVLVARGGAPLFRRALGFSHRESQSPNTLDTPFRIASLSKQFTAAAIFRLEGQGKLRIDAPVHDYLPELAAPPYRDITIHHLLTHTAGFPRTPQGPMGGMRWNAMSRKGTPVDDYVRLAAETPLEFEPGTDYQYSNFGYRILSAVIARVTGRAYADFMEEEIFRPLGMTNSGVARVTRPASEARVAEGLMPWKLPFVREMRFKHGEDGRNFGTGYGSGGIYTSANDLLRWDRVLAGDAFLTEEQKGRLFRPVLDDYACGWSVYRCAADGHLCQSHSGANEGFFSKMMRIPEEDLVIIALGNVEDTPAIDAAVDQIFDLCHALPARVPQSTL